jgi:hypothetical protein
MRNAEQCWHFCKKCHREGRTGDWSRPFIGTKDLDEYFQACPTCSTAGRVNEDAPEKTKETEIEETGSEGSNLWGDAPTVNIAGRSFNLRCW